MSLISHPSLGRKLLLFGLALLMVGCGSTTTSPQTLPGAGQASLSTTASKTTIPTVVGSLDANVIPPGRSFAEGGGGPLTYTFREEWRRALAQAQAWDASAYLVDASGNFVNNDGVPSSWAFNFVGQSGIKVLRLEIDPWGKITASHEVSGEAAQSLIGVNAKPIPYQIIDSDQAVTIGESTMAARYDLLKTRDPSLGLRYSEADGSGPYWTYTLFYQPAASYVSTRIEALTGKIKDLPGI